MSGKTAFISVYDKTGLEELAGGLQSFGFNIYAYGSSYSELSAAGLDVFPVEDGGNFHQAVVEVIKERRKGGKLPFPSLVISDLPVFPDRADLENDSEEVLKFLDFSNSNLLKAAASRFGEILTVCDKADYSLVLEKIKIFDEIPPSAGRYFAAKAFNALAFYEASVSAFLFKGSLLAEKISAPGLRKKNDLAYGENPHQKASLYCFENRNFSGVASAVQLCGGPLNSNHYSDLDSAYGVLSEFPEPACVFSGRGSIHAFSANDNLSIAFEECLKNSGRGGAGLICAFNRSVGEDLVLEVFKSGVEMMAAAEYAGSIPPAAFRNSKIKAVKIPLFIASPSEISIFSVSGGLIFQEKDNAEIFKGYKKISSREPSLEELNSLRCASLLVSRSRTYSTCIFSGSRSLACVSGAASSEEAAERAVKKLSGRKGFCAALDGPLSLEGAVNLRSAGVTAVSACGAAGEESVLVDFINREKMAFTVTAARHFSR